MMLGSRFLGDPLAGGMPRWKYVANRFLTGAQNLVYGLRMSEYHTGFRIGEIAVPTRYFAEASSVNFRRSVVYGLSTLRNLAGHRRKARRRPAHGPSRRSPAGNP